MAEGRALRETLLGLSLTLGLAAGPAGAAVPDEAVVLTRAATVEEQALPALLSLPGATVSALELNESFALGIWFDSDDLLAYTVSGDPPARIDPSTFVPPVAQASYYDPALGSTQPVRVVQAIAGGGQASFEVGAGAFTLSELLAAEGAVLVFVRPVPEPSMTFGLLCGAAGLLAGGRARRMSARPGRFLRAPRVRVLAAL